MNNTVIGIGEVLWDLLPAGPQLGGAPANFACHARMLGAQALVVSRIGADDLGRQIVERFKQLQMPGDFLQVDHEAPTGTVSVKLSRFGSPDFTIHEHVAWDRLATPPALEAVRHASAVCFGTLGQRDPVSRAAVQQLVAAAPAESLRVLDINLRQKFYSREVIKSSLYLANIFKLNDTELPVLAEMFGLRESPRRQLEKLARLFGLRLIALTQGAQGSLLYEDGRWSEQPAKAVQVIDTVGAGDAFTAALVVGLLNRMDLDTIHAVAAEVAGYVCSQPGATPPLPGHLREKFTHPADAAAPPVPAPR